MTDPAKQIIEHYRVSQLHARCVARLRQLEAEIAEMDAANAQNSDTPPPPEGNTPSDSAPSN